MSAAAAPSCAYCTARRMHLLALLLLAELDAGGAEEAEALGDEGAGVRREHLPLGRAQEDGERRRPGAEQLDDLRVVALLRGDLGLGDLGEVDGASAMPARGALELFANVGADARAELVELVRLLDAVVEEVEAASLAARRRACAGCSRRAARAAGSGRRCGAACASTSVSRSGAGGVASSVSSAPTRRWRKSASVRRCTSASPSSSLGGGDHEVDQGVVRVAAVDGERGDPGARDHREREEGLAHDVAERLEAADAIADALEPAVGSYGVEREDAFFRHG